MKQPLTPEQRLQLAKDSIDNGAPPDYAIAHALIALTEAIITEDVIAAEEPDPIVSWQGAQQR